MMCDAIAMKLRRSAATAQIFGDRVTVVADESRAVDYTALAWPAAYVTFLNEEAERAPPGTAYMQAVFQRYAVIVGLEATADVRGQKPTEDIDNVRARLYRAIYNWSPFKQFSALSYDGCELMMVSRAATFWRFRFASTFWICEDDGELDQFEPPAGVTDFDGINIKVDFLDPHDPGLPPSETYDPARGPAPWPKGPEGRIEIDMRADFPRPPTPRRMK